MRRRLILLASWLAATAVAVGVALAGVQLVAQRVVEPLPVAFAEVSVEPTPAAPAAGSPSPETSPSPDDPAPALGSSASPGEPGSSDDSGSSPPPRSSPSPDDVPTGDEGSEDDASEHHDVSDGDASDDDASDDDDDPSSPTASQAETRTYSLVGGTVTVEFSATSVRVVQATPHDGFTRDVDQKGATEVRVEFRSEDHRSRLDAWWDGGPRAEVDEDADD